MDAGRRLRARDRPPRRRLLVGAVAAACLGAAVVALLLPANGLRQSPGTALVLVAMGALAGAFPVRLPSRRVDVTVTHPFSLCALAALGPFAALLSDVAGVMGAGLGRGRAPRPIHFAYNVASSILATGASWVAFLRLGGRPGADLSVLLFPMAAATVAYFLANSFLVTLAIALELRRPVLATLRDSCLWTAPTFAAGFSVAVAMLRLTDFLLPWGFLVALPPCILIVAFHRSRARTEKTASEGGA